MKKILLPLLVGLLVGTTACKHTADSTDNEVTRSEITDIPVTLLNQNGSTALVSKGCESDQKVISTIQVVNTKKFEEKVCELNNPKGFQYKGEIPAVVDFYADWCGPCRSITPHLVELAKEYAGQIIVYKVNIDKYPEISQAFGVRSIPTLLYMKPNAQPVSTVGAMSKDEIKQVIDDTLLK